MNARAYLAEFLGTFLFMAIGYLSVVALGFAQLPSLIIVPFSFGLGLLAAIFAFGHVSGGHFNPAVTISMALDRRTVPADAVGYIVAQVLGAILAGLLVAFVFDQAAVAAGITKPQNGVTDLEALLLETVMTAGFVMVILAATRKAPALAALAIPLTLVAIHFAVANLTGASVNPARSIGSALVGGDLAGLWIYIVAPTVGAIIAWGLWRAMGEEEEAA